MSYFSRNRPCISLMGKWYQLFDPTDELSVDNLDMAFLEKRTGLNTVSIPSVFNVSPVGKKYVGAVWYQRKVTIPAHAGILSLWMEGWYGKAEFYIDSCKIGERLYGYTPYRLYFKPKKENLTKSSTYIITIKIDNREQEGQTFSTPVFTQWGGIHRPIEVQLLSSTFIDKALFTSKLDLDTIKGTPNDLNYIGNAALSASVDIFSTDKNAFNTFQNSADFHVKIGSLEFALSASEEATNPNPLGDSVMDLENGTSQGLIQHRFRFTAESERVKLWHYQRPQLHLLQVILNNDEISYRVGIRDISTNDSANLLLNGSRVLFLGVNRHDEHPEFGPAYSPQFIDHDLQVMKQAHMTGFRPAHYPTTNWQLDVADQIGLMVIEEVPNYIMMPRHFADPKVQDRGRQMFREMIEAHYNHPSIVMWSMGNECKTHLPESKAFFNTLAEIGKELDKTRLLHFTGFPGIQNIAEMAEGIPHVAAVNVYYGCSTSGQKTSAMVLGGVLDNLRSFMEEEEELLMKDVPLMISEFGSQAVAGYHDVHPYHGSEEPISTYTAYTEERQADVIEKFIQQIRTRSYVAGIMVWCWRDNRYEPEISDSAAGRIMRYGLLDWSGQPKLAFHVLARLYKELQEEL